MVSTSENVLLQYNANQNTHFTRNISAPTLTTYSDYLARTAAYIQTYANIVAQIFISCTTIFQ